MLVHLAATKNLKRIIQVAYLRPNSQRPTIEGNDEAFPIPDSVWDHFRNINDIRRLAKISGFDIEIIETPYITKQRTKYTQVVVDQIENGKGSPVIIFLDPDTGIAERNAKPEHVTSDEVQRIWFALRPLDLLVLYQHSHRDKQWVQKKRAEFGRAIGTMQIMTFRAKSGPTDVAFFCAERM